MRTSGERAWRSAVVSRAGQLRTIAGAAAAAYELDVQPDGHVTVAADAPASRQRAAMLANRVVDCAAEAEWFAEQRSLPLRWLSGALLEGAWVNLHAAEEHVIELLPDAQVRGHVPLVVYQVRKFLRATDPRREAVETRWKALKGHPDEDITAADRTLLGVALRGVHYRNAVGFIRVRSMRNLQIGFAAVFVVLALGFAALGWRSPAAVSLCLPKNVPAAAPSPAPSPSPSPSASATGGAASGAASGAAQVVCPTGPNKPAKGDVALVELLGLAGAAVAAARAVSGSTRPAGPYSTLVGQALLKTVLGAMTALLGVWFLSAGFVPGVDDVDSAAEILVYAVVFGYAQQLLTRLIDRRSEAADAAQAPAPAADDPAEPAPAVQGG